MLVVFYSIFSCQNRIERNICEKELLLLSPNNQLRVINIELQRLNDSILIKNGFNLNCLSAKKQEFITLVDNIKIKVYIKRNCCLCIRTGVPSITIFPNDKEEVLISGDTDTIVKIKEVSKWLKNNYLLKENKNRIFSQIDLGWTKNISAKDLNKVIHNVINGYIDVVNQITDLKYKKKICDLKTKEFNKIKEEYPLNLKLINLSSKPLVPVNFKDNNKTITDDFSLSLDD